jgi:RNA polymerase sigma-70 factor (ECF subfamily)
MSTTSDKNSELLRRARQGDPQALGDLLAGHRERLRLMVRLRLDGRLQGRIDPSDVIQEACLEACERFPEYARESEMPFFLWLRFIPGSAWSIASTAVFG